MSFYIALAAMMLLVLVNNMNETPMCGDCGRCLRTRTTVGGNAR